MKDITKKYTNGEVTVIWKPSVCIHSQNCFRGLREVFDPGKKPWVTIEGASTQRIVEQIKKCPSGALSYEMKGEEEITDQGTDVIVEPSPNGPLLIRGNLKVKSVDGLVEKNNVTAFCRCGASNKKPFCDGSHRQINFQG